MGVRRASAAGVYAPATGILCFGDTHRHTPTPRATSWVGGELAEELASSGRDGSGANARMEGQCRWEAVVGEDCLKIAFPELG